MGKHSTAILLPIVACLALPAIATAAPPSGQPDAGIPISSLVFLGICLLALIASVIVLLLNAQTLRSLEKGETPADPGLHFSQLNAAQLSSCLRLRKGAGQKTQSTTGNIPVLLSALASLAALPASAQPAATGFFSNGGFIITIALLLIPVIIGLVLMTARIRRLIRQKKEQQLRAEAARLAEYLDTLPEEDLTARLGLTAAEQKPLAGGRLSPAELKALIRNSNESAGIRFIPEKRKAVSRPRVDAALSRLVIAYLISAAVWLVFGTSVGFYLGIKFVSPEVDQLSWLSFGRLRPVHTNAVFWGWASLAMLGLAYYVVPRVGNTPVYRVKWGWYSLHLINAAVLLGSVSLMAGINNGGGEYREYIWPIQLLFAAGLVITLVNFLKTVARRTTKEIYISNWYIITAIMFVLVISIVAYIPYWQNGLGETIIQGYYMHQGVGMWFMLLTLGLVYYFLPQQLNKPIYSYGLGILAFWSQIFFYTVIGTHHFVFSAIPWSLQTVAIVGSVGMVIPVVSGTTNFLMTLKGSWNKIAGSYTLPFFLIGIIFYFTGSLQGTAEAFRSANMVWHFTDFTVAHSHMTMYGIISFFLWGAIYAVVPRLTRREPPQATVGIHFWLAFIGLLFYSIPLMIGSTLRGMMWMEGKSFIDSVVMMAPYWLWRAIGGTLMWAGHLVFAFNMYKMIRRRRYIDIRETALEIIRRRRSVAAPAVEA
ncbi:MAG TPA: cbb3-type cytochrome c oxidase subunit I [Chitinophagaceae bacterium]